MSAGMGGPSGTLLAGQSTESSASSTGPGLRSISSWRFTRWRLVDVPSVRPSFWAQPLCARSHKGLCKAGRHLPDVGAHTRFL